MSPPDAQEPPARGSSATLFDSLQSTPGGQAPALISSCWVCGQPTLRTGVGGRPVHAACEPRDVGLTGAETSHSAAGKAAKGIGSPLAKLILAELAERGAEGATDSELQDVFHDQPPGSVSKRRCDCTREGLVADSGRTRQSRWGRDSIVWVATGG